MAIRNLCGSLCAIGVSFFLWLYTSELASSTEGIKDSGDSNMINISNSNEKQVEIEDSSSYTSTSPETQFPYFETSKFVTIIGVIVFSAIIRLASSGTIIIIQKDLTVVISNNDTDYLSSKSKNEKIQLKYVIGINIHSVTIEIYYYFFLLLK